MDARISAYLVPAFVFGGDFGTAILLIPADGRPLLINSTACASETRRLNERDLETLDSYIAELNAARTLLKNELNL